MKNNVVTAHDRAMQQLFFDIAILIRHRLQLAFIQARPHVRSSVSIMHGRPGKDGEEEGARGKERKGVASPG